MTTVNNRPTVICVTPVRNEAWTLERHLRCAELWADQIILGDQGSIDGTRAIAARFKKVTVVDNAGDGYDEGQRHRVVLEAARRIPGPRVIIAVDADEAISGNWAASPEWEAAIRSPAGTVLTAEWINYLPDWNHAWVPKRNLPIGFVDDGREHSPGRLHVERIVVRRGDVQRSLGPVKLLHFQYVDWARMKSKQRRYQCIEILDGRQKRPIQIYRQYHRMDGIPKSEMLVPDPEWLQGYEERGIDMRGLTPCSFYRSDEDVIEMLVEHGPARFRRLDIWEVPWVDVARNSGRSVMPGLLGDPRTRMEKRIHAWLAATQRRDPDRWTTRFLQRALIPFGW